MSERTRFEELVLQHLDAGYNLARWLARNIDDAEDVVQDACVRAACCNARLYCTQFADKR